MENRSFRKSLAVVIVALFLGVSVIPNVVGDNPSFSKTIYVDDDNTEGPWYGTENYPYQFIQDGIDNASIGDTIIALSGIYYESLSISHSIILLGENKNTTFIHGGNLPNLDNSDVGIRISYDVNFVIISDFSICYWDLGIILQDNTTIINCNISNNHNGLSFSQLASLCTIMNNDINNNTKGIDMSHRNLVDIKYNCFINNEYGILYWNSFDNDHCHITNNVFRENLNGIDMQMIHETFIENNTFINNYNGILLEGSERNSIKSNIFIDNQLGIRLNDFFSLYLMLSIKNDIMKNNFIGNEVHANFYFQIFRSSPPLILNNYVENYWDDWNGFGPKLIWGIVVLIVIFIPIFQCDWHPAKEPYDIDA